MRQSSYLRFCLLGLIVVVMTRVAAGAGPKPGTECKTDYFDIELCNSTVTLLGCDYEGEKKVCRCVNLPDTPIPIDGFGKVVISMEWDADKGKCVSRTNSLCSIVKGDTEIPLPDDLGGGTITIASLDCKDDWECYAKDGYPKEFGACGSTGLVIFNGLIVGSVMILKMISIL